ncbi:putative ABC transporter ATP-binding protein YxlF [mine drainage metagenome]|uniref:Putative ABC transporter ATP-binding protein YxlF n=1 Tax=mine drainage metagenome TaxID=410659 RepID=A0A1J5RS00_9ZZZZ
MANNVIEVRQVAKRYGEVQAVDGVDLAIEAGQVFGLIGHNGAGKSTLFKMMLGLVPATSGEILIDGWPVRGEEFRRVRRHIGYLPENVVFYDNLSGIETLAFFARLKGIDRSECGPLLERVGLSAAADRRVKGYSKGMRQRLGFAQALLGEPKLLFLDEPTTGLDPEGIREFYRILKEMGREGATIMLTSHILSEIQERVDRLAIMKTGKIQAIGTVQSLREMMALPLRFELRLAVGAEAELRRAIAGLEGAELGVDGEWASVLCRREAKMAVLQALAALDGRVVDLHVREPSLEDVFLGYSG